MGQGKLNLSILAAGCFTIGGIFGASQGTAHAIVLDEVIIVAGPVTPCEDITIDPYSQIAVCEDDGETYDVVGDDQ
jgi:hypothetical protein